MNFHIAKRNFIGETMDNNSKEIVMKKYQNKFKMRTVALALAVGVFSICMGGGINELRSEGKDEELALQLTGIFRAYRATVAKKPDSIHKPSEYFTKDNIDGRIKKMHMSARIFFKVATKKKYPPADDTVNGVQRKNMEKAFEQVLRDYVDGKLNLKWKGDNTYISKWDGKMLPARFAANAAKYFNEFSQGKATIKLTTSKKLLVNKDNAPDEWESKVIDDNLINSTKSDAKNQTKVENGVYRFMLPEFYAPGCIKCHGTDDGQEGFSIHPSKMLRKINDFAGGISIKIKQ